MVTKILQPCVIVKVATSYNLKPPVDALIFVMNVFFVLLYDTGYYCYYFFSTTGNQKLSCHRGFYQLKSCQSVL